MFVLLDSAQGWHFKVRTCVGESAIGFVGWCAQCEDLGDSPMELSSTHDVYFGFGTDAAEVLGHLKAEVLGH